MITVKCDKCGAEVSDGDLRKRFFIKYLIGGLDEN